MQQDKRALVEVLGALMKEDFTEKEERVPSGTVKGEERGTELSRERRKKRRLGLGPAPCFRFHVLLPVNSLPVRGLPVNSFRSVGFR